MDGLGDCMAASLLAGTQSTEYECTCTLSPTQVVCTPGGQVLSIPGGLSTQSVIQQQEEEQYFIFLTAGGNQAP